MTAEQLRQALYTRKTTIEGLMLRTKRGTPEHEHLWSLYCAATTRYVRAFVWLR